MIVRYTWGGGIMEMLEDMMDKTKAGKVMNPIVAETSHVDLHIFS